MQRWPIALVTVLLCLSPGLHAQSSSRADMTPVFCQTAPGTDFPNKGVNYCGPVAASDAIVYLSQAVPLPQLVPGAFHENQIDVIKELASDMLTNPSSGTSMDGFLTGIETYVKAHACALSRCEVVTMRPLDKRHEGYRVADRLDPAWMTAALRDRRCAVMLSASWYYTVRATGIPGYEAGGDPAYYRHYSGHWVTLVDEGPTPMQFYVHNPGLSRDKQLTETTITLSELPSDMTLMKTENGVDNLNGFYRVDGAGFPNNDRVRGVVESVVVLSVKPDKS